MAYEITKVLNFSLHALEEGGDLEQQTHDFVYKAIETRYKEDRAMGEYTVSLLPDPAIIMTQCYAETLIGYVLSVSLEMGKKIELICPETRPYLQGARLTASDAYDLGVPVTVITDNMPGYMLSLGKVDAFVCAADVITVDGYIVNKIGTLQIALAADHFYATRNPSVWNPTIDTVDIEERNPEEVVHAMGIRTAKPGVNGYYPAFDITPPSLVSAVVTSKGIFSPYNLGQHFKAA
jgi:methylthioribose-1-phosphate isomerase